MVIVEIRMSLYNMKNEVPQNSLYFWNYQCSIVYFLQDSNNWITFFDDFFCQTFFFSIDFFLSTTNIISTIREQTGIRRKRNKFVLFDNHSLISDRFHFLLSNQPQLYSAIHKKYTTFNIFDVFIIGYNNFMEKGKTENEFVYTFRRGVWKNVGSGGKAKGGIFSGRGVIFSNNQHSYDTNNVAIWNFSLNNDYFTSWKR